MVILKKSKRNLKETTAGLLALKFFAEVQVPFLSKSQMQSPCTLSSPKLIGDTVQSMQAPFPGSMSVWERVGTTLNP